ncbi:hypothetical protein HXX76_002579 [Chlamydomonas incerta]|uniref:SET domain-containing protein n=1 Tax=Chlamydomonas incerta TaxID=51695 RepID=A0A835TCB0_CHLIN|nr:hypothetical protein HXX76_002579 [Chlamydomonas incerta]|eukprot:KAG2442493.1 hypothetical protein HXX76_002579 [Chlamydomonas incerta]
MKQFSRARVDVRRWPTEPAALGTSTAGPRCSAPARPAQAANQTGSTSKLAGNNYTAASSSINSSSSSSSASSGGDGGSGFAAGHWPPPLEQWLVAHGGVVNGVELRQVLYPSGASDRLLVASRDHAAGDLLVSVPAALQLRYDNIEAAAAAAAAAGGGGLDAAGTDDLVAGAGGASLGIPPAEAAALLRLFDEMPRGSDTGAPAWQFKQALTFLYHLSRGAASPLQPYLAHLPGLAPGVPTPRVAMLMYDDAVDELQYGALVQDIHNQKYWLRHVGCQLMPRLTGGEAEAEAEAEAQGVAVGQAQGGAKAGPGAAAVASSASPFGGLVVDEELFGWAAAVAMSRCFGLSRGPRPTHTCVPLVDMANHVAPREASNAEIRSGSDGHVAMFAKKQIRAGEEISLTYGTHDNHNLLLSYGFTLQPNPYDGFYFDLNMETIESLVEGQGGDPGTGGLAAWQRELIAQKLGLAVGGEGGGGADSIRVYLSGVTAEAQPTAAAAAQASAGSASAVTDAPAAGSSTSGPVAAGPVRQPVDPRLLAALRIGTLQDRAWEKMLAGRSVEQIGAWGSLLARQQEITIMQLLTALASALYSSFPTTIQQDRQLLSSASLDVAAAAAAVTLTTKSTTPELQEAAGAAAPPSSVAAATSGSGARREWPMHPSRPGAISSAAAAGKEQAGSASLDPAAAAAAAHARDAAEAVRFRLGLKTTLERNLQAVVARAKELDSLKQVR